MKILFLTVFVILGMSCSSNKHEVEELETTMEVKGNTEDGKVGLNKDGEAIIQEEVAADKELRRQEWANNSLKEELETEHDLLKKCRNDLADPRLGGRGEAVAIPEIDSMKSYTEKREELGLVGENKDLKVVRKSYFKDKLKSERKLESSLRDMTKIVKKNNEKCGRKLANARVKSGLPAKPYKAKGYFDGSGNWIQSRKAERSLDDAFEIMKTEKAKQ